ncbi:MAG TPA: adenosylcobinamide-phosphate synthase CbiB [Amaricoccus sp.]|uniref:adenosylcobinamide-phosphate synthase CbiB n=1 Tax=Amaricoccus sp. TaxID=1872485 RepID=UPI002B75B56C|nr:adenosylcobinamide-phosphate synthase CbiB [Amaricoccus sp.]HMQ93574.1 adenosylcobinamide-phosphate synthase CbiB [Amaricoccus sp.]HMR53173.1 adenosylcobinamide-phosphate synthase CbiB [Amaricoccus sp.]HMR62107.1 adenosylcobinamide-phosphate synthase CbiB [Amaricoccus sp.]HMU00069.1 adenosylcobinamide-phosphate synthase CbiB [Amaricoccus sp.]
MLSAGAMLFALGLEAVFGWPEGLYRRIGHPVTWIGTAITWSEAWLNRPGRLRIAAGGVVTFVVTASVAAAAWMLTQFLPDGWLGMVLSGVLAAPFVAARSLHEHVAAVARRLVEDDLVQARQEVAKIVGRETDALDLQGVSRAALESLAENASDGVVAPLFWGVLLGLPGIAGYKAINTLDSMIGHRTPRHAEFGRVAARLDDLANWLPARITAGLFALASGRPGQVARIVGADARRHRSPNAGWPEAAMAGAVGVRLSGPRIYGAVVAEEPWLNGGARDPGADELLAGLKLYRRMGIGVALVLLALALL